MSISGHLCVFLFKKSVQKLSSVQFSHSAMSNSLWPHESQHARPPCPSSTQSPPKLMSIESVMPSYHLILWCPHLLLPSIFSSNRVFSSESALHIRWPKCWNFSFSIGASSEYSGLISFRIDWFALLAVQGTLQESSPGLWFESVSSSAVTFLMVRLSSVHDYWKNHSFDYTDLCQQSDVSVF